MATVPRISRSYLDDETLHRAKDALLAQESAVRGVAHSLRKRGLGEAADEVNRDAEALGAVLGILLVEQRERAIDDRELGRTGAA